MAKVELDDARPVPEAVWRARFPMSEAELRAFCEKWQIAEFALFGSILRDDWREESDIDVLTTFAPGAATWSLFDLAKATAELTDLTGRRVDLLERKAVEAGRNPFRRRAILGSYRIVHVAG